MPSPGRSSQRGFVRNVGMTRSRRDRQNMRDPAVIVHEMPPEKSEQQVKLDWLRAEHPELYKQAEVFASYFDDYSEAEKVGLMVTRIEKTLAEEAKLRREEQMLDDYDKART